MNPTVKVKQVRHPARHLRVPGPRTGPAAFLARHFARRLRSDRTYLLWQVVQIALAVDVTLSNLPTGAVKVL
jgi:hypothetical protein